MWGIGVGIILGILQLVTLNKLIIIITSEKIKISAGVTVTLLKMTFILFLFCFLAKYSGTASMLWCAGSSIATVIIISLFNGIKNIKRYQNTEAGEN